MNLALFLAPLVVLTRLAAVIFFAPLASFACEFHHDGSLLTEFDPDSEEFITKVEKAEKDCEDTELAVSGNCTIDLETGSVSGEKCSSDEAFEAPVFTSTGTIEKDVPVRGSNNTNKMSANWARFPFTRGALPPKFADKQKLRAATGAYISQEQGEGAGARVRRSIGRPELRNVDPFLMLDEFKVGLPAGFPDHPHRGMETVTYMLPDTPGKMTHEDSKGNAGTLAGQDLQWMTAAKGIMHSEVPETQAEAHGLQMWINLPRTEKMKKPEYQEVRADKLARAEAEDETGKKVQCAIAAGEALGIQSSVRTRTPTIFVHVNVLEKGGTFRQVIPKNFTGFLYTLGGCEITVVGDGRRAGGNCD